MPAEETSEVVEVFEEYGLPHANAVEAAHALRKDRKRWVDFMMRFELGLEKPDPRARPFERADDRALLHRRGADPARRRTSSCTRCRGRCVGSVVLTLVALFVFGYVKGRYTVKRPLRSAWQTALVGGIAAGAAFAIAKAIG